MSSLSHNVSNFITLKLKPDNYPLWREQVLSLELNGENQIDCFVDDTSKAVWDALKEAYAQDSQEREFTLRQQLTYLCKNDSNTIAEHIQKFKSICDSLAEIRSPVSDKEKVFSLLTSLVPKYESFTTSLLKPPRQSYTELVLCCKGMNRDKIGSPLKHQLTNWSFMNKNTT
ncbi:hypothetical protein M9H77_08187 [Catharanthus roseus]|uniref:Uncharacterized protein n=1 Tax=Catharanthus roseus TaxID=4058 RepID=A0ACC0BXA9_CATRO|nr:hypothetical protein M9H77_08187 [Catharanthus roseus]